MYLLQQVRDNVYHGLMLFIRIVDPVPDDSLLIDYKIGWRDIADGGAYLVKAEEILVERASVL